MDQSRQFQSTASHSWVKQVPGGQHGSFTISNFNSFTNINYIQQKKSQERLQQEESIQYFERFFSPKDTAQSLKRRNDNLQMLNFQNSDEQPDDVYNRRIKKVADLINREQQQLSLIQRIKNQDYGKFFAIIQFIKFFCLLKDRINGTRTDYYSSKTFSALKNTNEAQLIQLTKIINKMFNNVMQQNKCPSENSKSTSSLSNHGNEKIVEFLIIPRFLISKQKINRLTKDEVLQKNFEFLVFHQCLGHYNNQANKKMPEQTQMIYVRQLLVKKNGRQKFKKICSINHGNKFFKNYQSAYYQLYSKSLQYLKQLDMYMKKGKKFENIKKQLDKLPNNIDDAFNNSSTYTESQSSNSIYNFNTLQKCLNKIENSENQSQIKSQMKDEFADFADIQKPKQQPMKKRGMRKLMSMPLTQQKQERPREFSVRKSQTMQARTTQNIFVVPPQFNYQA